MKDSRREVFISGATRYVGSRLIPELLRRGHMVPVLVRSGSEKKLPQGCAVTVGDVLNSKTFMTAVPPAGTLVHLVGVPSPAVESQRVSCESLVQASGVSATILRPRYILGPGQSWPIAVWPIYKMLECLPATAASARHLGLVTIEQMIAALMGTIEPPADGVRIIDVPGIRALGSDPTIASV
jgi:uncharacterized protein YbjT (DUF2867 family)